MIRKQISPSCASGFIALADAFKIVDLNKKNKRLLHKTKALTFPQQELSGNSLSII